jgi:hypothetical protein
MKMPWPPRFSRRIALKMTGTVLGCWRRLVYVALTGNFESSLSVWFAPHRPASNPAGYKSVSTRAREDLAELRYEAGVASFASSGG